MRLAARRAALAGLAMVPAFIEPDLGGRWSFSYWILVQARLR